MLSSPSGITFATGSKRVASFLPRRSKCVCISASRSVIWRHFCTSVQIGRITFAMSLTICMYFCIVIRDLNAFPHFYVKESCFCHANLHLFVLSLFSSDVNLTANDHLTPTLTGVEALISTGLEGQRTEKTPTLNRATARSRATREPRRLAALHPPPLHHTLSRRIILISPVC